MVIFARPAGGIPPFHVTVLVPMVATAAPLDAVAETRASVAGRTSVNSLPGLLPCAPGPALDSVIVYVTVLPTVCAPPETVLVPDTVAPGVAESVSVSVAELLAGVGSVTPAGAVTVAVLLSVPVARLEMVQVAVYVTLPPLGRFTVLLMLPEPEAVQVPPPAPVQVQVQVREA